MKKAILIIMAFLVAFAFLSGAAEARKKECNIGESMVSSMPEMKPEWVDQPHARLGKTERFVGLSTQNEKLEQGIELAVENANGAIVEALGQVIQKRSQGVLTFDSDEIRQSFGSAGAASFLKHKERKGLYYEKWVSYEKCNPKYYYNVWVLVVVPRDEYDQEALRAERYLRELQREEELRAKPPLMPAPEAMQVKELPRKTATKEPAAQPWSLYNTGTTATTWQAPQADFKPYEFHCGSMGFAAGYTYIPGMNSQLGRQNANSVNVNADAEWGIRRNFCMGAGMGWTMTSRADGGRGQIVPMYLRFAFKGPLTDTGSVIGWAGAEIGGAILHGFDRKGGPGSEQKTTAAFMAGPAAGVDFRLQGNLYLTISGAYTPIFYKDTIQMIQGRVGIRYYFGGH